MLANFNHLSRNDGAQLPLDNVAACSRRGAKSSNPCNDRNQQYSIVGLTNAAGTLVERYTYTAYGTLGIHAANGTVQTSSSYNNRYTYTGREWDHELKLYHFRARLYDPATGGFISRDPFGYVDRMSLYRGYFGVKGLDPSGKETLCAGSCAKAVSVTFAPWRSASPKRWEEFDKQLEEIRAFSDIARILDLLKGLGGAGLNRSLKEVCSTILVDQLGQGLGGGIGIDSESGTGTEGFSPTDLIEIFESWKNNDNLVTQTGLVMVIVVSGECCQTKTRHWMNPCGLILGFEYEVRRTNEYWHKCTLSKSDINSIPHPARDLEGYKKRVDSDLLYCMNEALSKFDCSKSDNFPDVRG